MDKETNVEKKEIPHEIESRHTHWGLLFKFFHRLHYFMGIFGILCSTMAGLQYGNISKFSAILAALCFAIIGYLRPETKYMIYVKAWRVLDSALIEYKYSDGSIDDLILALEKGEAVISESESQYYDQKEKGRV